MVSVLFIQLYFPAEERKFYLQGMTADLFGERDVRKARGSCLWNIIEMCYRDRTKFKVGEEKDFFFP